MFSWYVAHAFSEWLSNYYYYFIIIIIITFNVFKNELWSAVKYSNFLLFGNDFKIHRKINSPYDSLFLQFVIHNVRVWFISNYMKLNVNKPRAISFCIKANWHDCDYKQRESSITRTDCVRDLWSLIDTALHIQRQVDNIFSQSIRWSGSIRTVTFSVSSLHSLLTLHCTFSHFTVARCLCCVEFYHFFGCS